MVRLVSLLENRFPTDMKLFNTQLTTDKFAGTVSLVCALQCLLMPSFFIATSGLVSLSIDNESGPNITDTLAPNSH